MNDMAQNLAARPQELRPDQPIAATLEAQQWNIVLSALQEMPMRVARPVFDRLLTQLQSNS